MNDNLVLPPHILNPDPKIYLSDSHVTLDVETTNYERGSAIEPRNQLLLSSYKYGRGQGILSKWGDEHHTTALYERISASDFIIAHNAKFELQWMVRAGIDISKIVVFDTLLAEYVLAGNRHWPLDLDSVAAKYGVGGKGSVVSKLIKGGVCPSEIPQSWLQEYCEQDVRITELVFKKQLRLLIDSNLLPTLFTRCLFTVPLADIEFNGVFLDEERVNETHEQYTKEYHSVNQRLEQFSKGLNWNSKQQVATFLYGELGFTELRDGRGNTLKTPGGNPSTSASTIAKLQPRNKQQAEFLRAYKERSKLGAALTKNLDFFYGTCKEKGSVFRASFNQAVTRTHRLSSSGRSTQFDMFPKPKSVQFQNMPRVFKKLCAARHKGWKVGETDGAQLEFRGAAFLGNDAQAKADIRNGVDVHAFTASVINNVPEEEVTKEQRQDAKADTFKPTFGGKSGTPDQVRYYEAFRKKYHELSATQQNWVSEVICTKELVTITGLKFYWPTCKVEKSGYVTNNESIHNYPIQSFSTAEVIPISIVYQWHRMVAAKMESFLVNTVHDSSIGEIAPNEEELYEEIAVQSYTHDVYAYLNTVYNIQMDVPLGVEVKIGSHWGEGKETKYDIDPPYNNN